MNFLIVMTSVAGFYVGSLPPPWRVLPLLHTLFGTLLVASGTGTLNQYLERNFDALMRRTAKRPLPAARIHAHHALWFGICLAVAGGLWLGFFVNYLASAIAILTLLTYLLCYTPLKRKTPLCTLVGAFPGAAPPLIGCAAAHGSVNRDGWLLYVILFFWQFPHFMAIAWMYREDYARAGYLTLPRNGTRARFMAWQTLIFSFALIPATVLSFWLSQAGPVDFALGLLSTLAFVFYSARLVRYQTNQAARRLLFASILYLPVSLIFITAGVR